MNNALKIGALWCLSLALLGTGCASVSPARDSRDVVAVSTEPREAVRIFSADGQPASWDDLVSEAASSEALFIGEMHGHPLGLAAAACLWEDVLAGTDQPALLMEFFERDHQVALDDYLAGLTETDVFREASERTAGNYPAGHERMVEAARSQGVPVIAANAPRRYVRLARTEGYQRLLGLSEAQRGMFVIPDAPITGRYRDDFFELMSGMAGHGGGDGGHGSNEMVESMFRSQSLWDSTMGASVADALNDGARPAVLVIGRFHTDFDGGTVQMVQRHRPDLRFTTVSMVASDAGELADEDAGRADFVIYVGSAG